MNSSLSNFPLKSMSISSIECRHIWDGYQVLHDYLPKENDKVLLDWCRLEKPNRIGIWPNWFLTSWDFSIPSFNSTMVTLSDLT